MSPSGSLASESVPTSRISAFPTIEHTSPQADLTNREILNPLPLLSEELPVQTDQGLLLGQAHSLDQPESLQTSPAEDCPDTATQNGNGTDSQVESPLSLPLAALTPHKHDPGNGKAALQPSLPEPPKPKDSEPEEGFLPVLRNRKFLTMWSGQIFSQLADKVYLVLMIAIVVNRFQEADQTVSGWVSSIMIAFTIPAVLFGSVAGVYVDRWFKKPVLVSTNLLRGALVLMLSPLLWISQGWSPLGSLPLGFCILLAITFLVSTLTQFFAPAEQAAIPLIVEKRDLLSANSLYTTTMMASVIVGFAVGEPLLAIADALVSQIGGAFGLGKELVVGGSYIIAGLILLSLRTDEKTARLNAPPHEQPHVWQDIRDGLRYLGKEQHVRAALIQLVILFSVFAALAVLAVRLAEILPEIKSSQFGFLLAAGGVGMACGAAVVGQFGQRFSRKRLSLYGSMGVAASLVGMSLFSHQLLPTLVLLTLIGGFAAVAGVPMQTMIQEETPEEMRGKVFGLQNNAINIALSLPLAMAGVAETFLGLQAVFLGLAILVVSGGLFTWYIADTGSHHNS
ncbi:MAG: MFS transporter [Scytolyngbya sp. HA4215-MV1]|nr:MFS transporter [Scytolyngbya sp. HA4215-MV1]